MWWQEERKPGVRGTGVHLPTVTRGASGVSPQCGNQGWGSSSDEDNITPGIAFRRRGFPQARSPLRLQMSVYRRHQMFSYLQAFSRLPPLTQMGRSLLSVGSTTHCGSALTRHSRLTVKTTVTGVTLGAPISHALQADTPLSFLTCTMTVSRLPTFWICRPAGLPVPPLSPTSATDGRQTNSRSSLGTQDPHVVLIRACWLRTSMARGMWFFFVQKGSCFVTDSSLAENFHIITQHHYTILLNKDTFTHDFTCASIHVSCSLRSSTWAFEGMVVTGMFRRAPDQSCSYFTFAWPFSTYAGRTE